MNTECTKGQSGVKGVWGCSHAANVVTEPSGQQLPGKLLAIAFHRWNHQGAVSYRNLASMPPLPGTSAHYGEAAVSGRLGTAYRCYELRPDIYGVAP